MRAVLAAGFALAALTSSAGPLCAQQRQGQQPATTWSGGQIGGFGGVSNLGGNFVEPGAHFCAFGFAAACPEVPFSFGGSRISATGGGFIGYSIPWGSYIIGIEADIAAKSGGSFSTQSNTHASPGGPTSETFTGALSQRWDGSVRARFGLPLYSTSMIYATGGVAFGQMSGSFAYNTAPLCVTTFVPALDVFVTTCNAGGGALSWSDTRAGVTGGAGMEWVYLRNIKLRVEYRYTDSVASRRTCRSRSQLAPALLPAVLPTAMRTSTCARASTPSDWGSASGFDSI